MSTAGDVLAGYRKMMDLTGQRGPWAYRCMEEREAIPVVTACDLGERLAVIVVRVDERRRGIIRWWRFRR